VCVWSCMNDECAAHLLLIGWQCSICVSGKFPWYNRQGVTEVGGWQLQSKGRAVAGLPRPCTICGAEFGCGNQCILPVAECAGPAPAVVNAILGAFVLHRKVELILVPVLCLLLQRLYQACGMLRAAASEVLRALCNRQLHVAPNAACAGGMHTLIVFSFL
jgi:hypothetical protein